VLLVAFGLRIRDLGHNPPELFEDEISGAISAWKIVTTGHDVEVTRLPFLATRLQLIQPVYGFTTVITQAILGRSVVAVRLPAVIFGIISTALVIWIMRLFGRSRVEALVAGGLFAVVPWAVHYGRIGWDPAALPPFSLGGLGMLWLGLRCHRSRFLVGGAALLALGTYTYATGLLINIILATAVFALHFRSLGRRDIVSLLFASGVALLVLVPYLRALFTEPLLTRRSAMISVFAQGVNGHALGLAWRNYWEQWNPEWLFFDGPQNLRNHPGIAMTFPWMAPFLCLGIWRLFSQKGTAGIFMLLWLVLGPLPAGLTNDGVPHFTRGLLALPPLVMVTAMGVVWAYQCIDRLSPVLAVISAVIVLTIACMQIFDAYRFYFGRYPAVSASAWAYGTGEAVTLAGKEVPAGATLCIDMLSQFTFWHEVDYYLGSRDFVVIERKSDPRCSQPGAYVLDGVSARREAPVRTVAIAPDFQGKPLYQLSEVTAR
jgi:4-amino-4-deoxy-L-arabinose transferase-like glycosyltransferase